MEDAQYAVYLFNLPVVFSTCFVLYLYKMPEYAKRHVCAAAPEAAALDRLL
jgi:hypothetical protein